MSTQTQSPIDTESKQQDTFSQKDDFKQQQSLKRKETKQAKPADSNLDAADAPADAGFVGGAVAAVQHAVDAGIHMLPVSMQAKAENLEAQAKHVVEQAAAFAAPVVESYQQDGLLAAAKTAGGIGAGAASTLKTSAQSTAADLASTASVKATNLKASAKASASNITTQATGVASTLKEKITGTAAAAAADTEAPKKHGRRRRGGRGHGNRKMKTREIIPHQEESIVDTLGEKAQELKDIVVEELAPSSGTSSKQAAAAPSTGIVGSVRGAVGSVTSGISNTVSSTVAGAKSTASNIVNSATSTAQGLMAGAAATASSAVTSAKGMVSGSEKASLQRKPTLQRRDELPSLGTPNTPGDSELPVHRTGSGKLAAAPSDQSSLMDKAKFAVGAARDYVADKIDNMSLNADDSQPLEGPSGARISKREAMANAEGQLQDMKARE